MELFSAVALILVGGYFVVLYGEARAKKLPLNRMIGFRTRAIMINENVWEITHKKYAGVFLLDGLLFISSGLVLGLSATDFMSYDQVSIFVLSIMGTILLVTVIGGVSANQFAKKIDI